MPNKEKVIHELVEHIESALNVDSDYIDCVRTDLLQYTVALLKEYQEKQEGLPPAWQDRTQEHVCQKCGGIVWQEDNYCSKCGQKVKWDA